MRARNIKPGFFTNEQLAECCFAARILYEGLWCLADRRGRLEDRTKRFKASVFPYDNVDVTELVEELEAQKLIVRYEVNGVRYIWIPKFLVHQRPHKKETDSTIPPCELELEYIQQGIIEAEKKESDKTDEAVSCHDLGSGEQRPKTEQGTVSPQPRQLPVGRIPDTGYRIADTGYPDSAPETQPPAEEAAASLSTPSGSKSQPQEPQPEPDELVLSADPAKPPAPSKPQPVSAQAIADLWNRMMPERGFARVTRVTNQRAAHIRARQREFKTRGAETLDFWRKVFVVTYRSDLLNGTRGRTGKDGRRWQADFDFCIESEEKLTRLIEGKYDNDDSGGYEWVDYQSPPQRLDKAG